MMEIDSVLEKLKAAWPSPLVARCELGRFSGGMLHGRTVANLDSLGQGPPRIRIGRKIGYDRDGLLEWLRGRMGRPGEEKNP
jgi:hypothetical protein